MTGWASRSPVDADPRAKQDAVLAIGARLELGARAADRLREGMDDLTTIATKLRARDDSASRALAAEADSVRAALARVRATLVGPEDVRRIVRDDAAAIPAVSQPLYRMLSSWDAPTEAQRWEAAAADRRLREALDATNQVFATEVAAFRGRLNAAGFRLLHAKEPISF